MKTIQKEHPISKIVREHIEQELAVDLKQVCRVRSLVYARFLYFKVMKEKTRLSVSAIGGFIGKDHASVLHGVKMFDDVVRVHESHLVDMYFTLCDMVDEYYEDGNGYESPETYWKKKYKRLLKRYQSLKEATA